ncbi:hypothetical protein [Streptomyces sp. NPDC058457]|uniref:hypothetical protein n=1 Tax=Streptomyces sp. NPDC058457 TaxID=3346507 RepID=UPI00364CE224
MQRRFQRPAPFRMAIGLLTALLAGATVAVGAAPVSAAADPVVYSVAPNGTGSACSAAAPCGLLTAQSKVRAATSTMTTDIDVVLADGKHQLDAPLFFDSAVGDSATGGHTVSYQAAPGAHPVLSGGQQVTGWAQGAGGVWSASVPAGTDTRQLYVDGVRANRASGSAATTFTRTATGYTTSDTTLAGWGNISDVEFVYGVEWTQMRCGVASVSGTTVTMQQPCFDNSTKKQYGVNADLPTSVENAKELLDRPGEFYLDAPPPGPRATRSPATSSTTTCSSAATAAASTSWARRAPRSPTAWSSAATSCAAPGAAGSPSTPTAAAST